jgi:hypothetical protein
MKPAVEHWILCRKPLAASSIARNVLAHGTGALNIAGCRVGSEPLNYRSRGAKGLDTERVRHGLISTSSILESGQEPEKSVVGRWPPNLLLSDEAIDLMEEQAPGVTRFFPTFRYQAKESRANKEAGLDALPVSTLNRVNPGGLENEPRFAPVQVKNNHPTVKSVELMRWLCRLITPPGGAVLDPFAGSGSTGVGALLEGFDFFGIEQDPHYVDIARARLAHWAAQK